jgi:hypothetical protein
MARGRFRGRNSYERQAPKREPFDVVLIVCEGGKTEPNYFEGLKVARRLGSANVDVRPMGMDPLSLVDHAIAELKKDRTIDRAYCVFDRDEHATFGAAVRKARDCALGRAGKLRIAVSVPSFEVWPLLHFAYSTAEIVAGGGKTPGERALSELLKVMPDYSKADRKIFQKLEPRLDDAMKNATKLRKYNRDSASDNPATDMHILVEYLANLKR